MPELKITCRASDNDKHQLDISHLLFHNGKLYSASDDGKIMVWSKDLTKLAEVHAHPCAVYCLTANKDTLCSCSDDGTIKLWELDTLKPKGTIVEDPDVEYWQVGYSSAGCLFSGDDQGNINVYKNNKLYGQINIAEPIRDMAVLDTLIFTVKDLDLVITEFKIEGLKIQYEVRRAFMGRAPVTLIGDKLFAFTTREGKEIELNEINVNSGFKRVARITDGSELLINALAGTIWNGINERLFSGGWDKILKYWTITRNYPENVASINLDMVINYIRCGDENQVYVGGADGQIIRIDVC